MGYDEIMSDQTETEPISGATSPGSADQALPASFEQVCAWLSDIFGADLHAKRVFSLAGATTGLLVGGIASVGVIGRGLAVARGLTDKHAIKQVDRLLGSDFLGDRRLRRLWGRGVIGEAKEVFINLDWTDFDDDDQTMLVASVQEGRGRSAPLVWKTVQKSKLKGNKWRHVHELMREVRAVLPPGTRAFIVADREFGDQDFYAFLGQLGLGYIIRFRANIFVKSFDGETRLASDWLLPTGKARSLRAAAVTGDEQLVGKVVIVRDKKMKAPWCLAASDPDMPTADIKKRYGHRFETEETFRDAKDLRFGMGMSWTRVSTPARRDALMFLVALAHSLLTLLGQAGEECGLDRTLKSNTSKTRQHSLYSQGARWYALIPTMPEERLRVLLEALERCIQRHPLYSHLARLKI